MWIYEQHIGSSLSTCIITATHYEENEWEMNRLYACVCTVQIVTKLLIEWSIILHTNATGGGGMGGDNSTIVCITLLYSTRQSEMADLARRATRWVGTWECACQISWWSVEKWRRYYILKFHGNTFRWPTTLTFDLKFWKYLSVTEYPYSMCMLSFMMIGWEMTEILHFEILRFSVTYDLDLWPKILKIFVSHRVPILNVYVKFHDDRLRNDWDITLWNFAKTRTNTHTHTQTDMGITIPRPPPMGGEVITLRSAHGMVISQLGAISTTQWTDKPAFLRVRDLITLSKRKQKYFKLNLNTQMT